MRRKRRSEPPLEQRLATAFSSHHVVLLRRNRWILALGCLPLVLTLFVAFTLQGDGDPALKMVLFPCIACEIALLHYLITRDFLPTIAHGRVVADARGVFLDNERILSREEIKRGVVVSPPQEWPVVALERRYFRSALRLRARNEKEARALLQALRLDASQSVVTFSLPFWKTLWLLGGPLMAGLMALHPLGAQALLPMLGLLGGAAFLIQISFGTHIRVGADGLVIRRLRRSRVVSYDALNSVGAHEERIGRDTEMVVRLSLKSGEEIKISFLRDALTPAMLVDRINAAWSERREGVAPTDEAMLARGGRETQTWVRSLRALGSGASASHRSRAVDPERLLAIAENPSASPTIRAGAAVALSTLEGQSRDRLRAAAEATAMPKVRAAIEAASGGLGEEELERALVEVEAEEAAAREQA